jgi:hypothetical protein
MQSTLQAALVTAGGADLSGQQTRLYRRRRRGGKLSPYQHEWLNASTPSQISMLEEIARGLDDADRELRRARRNGITVIDNGQILSPSRRTRPRRRGAGRPSGVRRSSARSGDSGDDAGESPGEADAAYLRGFLLYLIGFDWPEALIDSAYAFSVDIEREVTS